MIVKFIDEYTEIVDQLLKKAYETYKSLYKVKQAQGKLNFQYETIVYLNAEKPIATLSYYIKDSTVRLFKMAVHPEFQDSGIGSKLIEYVEKNIYSNELTKIGIYTLKETSNQYFFQRNGFSIISEVEADFAVSLNGDSLTELEMIKVLT